MKIVSSKLYEDYSVYKTFHKKTGRFYAAMVHNKTKKRKTIAYAKYVLSSYLGRELGRLECVDHKDENKLNDEVSNLQILTSGDNNRKSVIARGKSEKFVDRTCPSCAKEFKLSLRLYKSGIKNPLRNFFCSRVCSGSGIKKQNSGVPKHSWN